MGAFYTFSSISVATASAIRCERRAGGITLTRSMPRGFATNRAADKNGRANYHGWLHGAVIGGRA